MFTGELITYITMGMFLGLSAGISPGPLLALVISETLRHNKTEGFKIAVTPLITDAPVVIGSLIFFSRFSQINTLIGIISILGGIFIAYLGYESIKTKGLDIDVQKTNPQSFKKGIIANILSPYSYLFWITVGAPVTLKACQSSAASAVLFIISFYVSLCGSKIGTALLVDRSKAFLKNKAYIWIMRILGIILFIFAALYMNEGIKFL